MQSRLTVLLSAATTVGAIAALSSCGDPTALKAQFENKLDSTILYALNGTSSTLPSGLRLRNRLAIRLDATFAFDIAFDINEAGEVVVYTQRKVANELVPTHPVGLQISDLGFALIPEAPVTDYKYDSLVVLPVGKTLLVDNVDPSCGQFAILGPNIRAKLRVDSVVMAERAIFLHLVVNQNCGYRGLDIGLPER